MSREREAPTGSTLFVLLRTPDDPKAWAAFVARYGPRIQAWCRQRGLQQADAEDVTQEVLTKLVRKLRTFAYDPARGTFRAWLRTVTLHALDDYLEVQKRPGRGRGDPEAPDVLATVAAREDLVEHLREVFDHEVLAAAQERVQLRVSPRDWKLFQHLALEGRSGREVAAELGMTVAAALMARKRVQDRLREEIRLLEGGEGGTSEGRS